MKILVNKLLLIIIMGFSNISNAQIITGVLLDSVTSEPIPFVTIGVEGTSFGTISNEEGKFSFGIGKATSIVISHLNYGKHTIKIDQSKQTQTIRLQPLEVSLDEVIITDKPISDILLQAIDKSHDKLTTPVYLNTYYREFVKTNEKYTKFSDGANYLPSREKRQK